MSTITFDALRSKDVVTKTAVALTGRGMTAESVEKGAEALEKIIHMIPQGASVMNGASRTLEQIGYIEHLKSGQHGWNNLHAGIVAEKDPAKQGALRKQAVSSDFYLGSAHAVTEGGEIVIASASGSQLPHLAFTSPNIILVVSNQKIVPTLPDAIKRIEDHVMPLEDKRMKAAYGVGTARNKTLIMSGEHPMMGRKVHIIFVNEKLGF
jgi:L-lactate utilization protein LutC